MKQNDLLNLAKQYFIFDTGLSKANLVRRIQREQGHADCFATGKNDCDQLNCWWRQDCLGASGDDLPTAETDFINHVSCRSDSK